MKSGAVLVVVALCLVGCGGSNREAEAPPNSFQAPDPEWLAPSKANSHESVRLNNDPGTDTQGSGKRPVDDGAAREAPIGSTLLPPKYNAREFGGCGATQGNCTP